MPPDKSTHTIIAVEQSGKGWSVSISTGGSNTLYAVFRSESAARAFADNMRQKLSLEDNGNNA
jgi:hypothetical protein